MNREQAMTLVRESLAAAAPGADPSGLGPHDVIRDALEIDSLDFLGFVETLSERSGIAIDEDDYDALATLDDSAEFLLTRKGEPSTGRTP
jgi:acyl carrier protein